jgi:hypothetical protein
MTSYFTKIAWTVLMPGIFCIPSPGQELRKDMTDKIDAAIAEAYRSASTEFPCKIGTRGKNMLRWEQVDRCLNRAANKVDWDAVSRQLQDLRKSAYGVSESVFAAAVEDSLSAHALSYDKVFLVKNTRALLPLTNSILKFLPADSLQSLPVYDRAGTLMGTFSGVYSFERGGGLSTANLYRLTLFQYTDRNGNVQSASDKLLLDSFGVPWKEAMTQRGFRLTSDKLVPGS